MLQAGGLGADAPDAPQAANDDGTPGAVVCEVAAPRMDTGQACVTLWPALLLRNELPWGVRLRQLAAAADGKGVRVLALPVSLSTSGYSCAGVRSPWYLASPVKQE